MVVEMNESFESPLLGGGTNSKEHEEQVEITKL